MGDRRFSKHTDSDACRKVIENLEKPKGGNENARKKRKEYARNRNRIRPVSFIIKYSDCHYYVYGRLADKHSFNGEQRIQSDFVRRHFALKNR
jgi:hypothetical protein